MRRNLWIVASCLALCLMGCGEQEPPTYAESCWESISYSTNLDDYLAENAESLDMEMLQSEAGNAENTLSQQFRAIALLCAAEYGKQSEEYPISSSYVDAFLSKVLTDEENFWNALEEVSGFDEFLLPMLDAAKELDGEILIKILESIPEDDRFQYSLRQKLDSWIEKNPVKMLVTGDELIASGYFEDWAGSDWRSTFFYYDPQTDSVEEAVEYMAYLRDTILPIAQKGNDPAVSPVSSDLTGEEYLDTTLTIDIGEELVLQEPGAEDSAEEIETEGKKVLALYHNPHRDEFPDSPEPLRLIGDFMLNLSDQEYPASIEEADYYLVLTPAYTYGDVYYYDNGQASDIRQVNSITSIDLYEAGTGRFLRHLGNVIEEPAQGIVTNGSDNAPRYPEEVKADILYYIYSHVNDPNAYASLVDHLDGRTEFEKDETFIIGQWEITYHGFRVADSFQTELFQYTPDEGCQFIKAEFTVTNRGLEEDKFVSSHPDEWEEVGVYIVDFADSVYYECANQGAVNVGMFGTKLLDPGESQTGEMLYQVLEEDAKDTKNLYMAITKGNQILTCPLEED